MKKLLVLSLLLSLFSCGVSPAPALANTAPWETVAGFSLNINCDLVLPTKEVVKTKDIVKIHIDGKVVVIETTTDSYNLIFSSIQKAFEYVQFLMDRKDCV